MGTHSDGRLTRIPFCPFGRSRRRLFVLGRRDWAGPGETARREGSAEFTFRDKRQTPAFCAIDAVLTCLTVIAGFQPLSSSVARSYVSRRRHNLFPDQVDAPKIDRHTVPDGKTLGWKRGGTNLPEGVSSARLISHAIAFHPRRTLRWLAGIVFRKDEMQLVQTAGPARLREERL